MKNPLIFDAALSANWAIDEASLHVMLEIAAREHQITPQALEAYQARDLERAERATIREGVAILNVDGPLFKRANLMTALCGATSYDVLMRDFHSALDNGGVRAILLNEHSLGGEAAGVAEFSAAVYAARGKKPIVAYVGDQAASAAYWIASAADRIIIGPSAALGSIGVRAALTDTGARDEARGVKTVEFVSSQSPFKKVDLNTKQGRERVQARVDALAAVFVETVAQYRSVSVEHVLDKFGKGDVLIGKAAIEAGMADGFGSFESVLASLSRGELPVASTGFTAAQAQTESANEMETGTSAPAADTPAVTTEAAATVVANTQVDTAAVTLAAERARVSDIMGLTLPGYEKLRDEAIQSGSSAHEFSAKIIASEQAKAQQRANDVAADTQANAAVQPSTGTEAAKGDDAAVDAILGAFKLATGK